jgi:adenylate cyclase
MKRFTSVAQIYDAQTLMDWLNEYMEVMVKLVMDHGGVVNKYMGDGIMALFGVPVARTNESQISQDAINAVKCATAMRAELERLNTIWSEQDRPTSKMRVGIFTGPVVVGSLGSTQRLEYTVIGETVNIASRLESFDKAFDSENPCRILIGPTTLHHLGDQFQTKELSDVSLEGKDQRVTIYQVTGLKDAKDWSGNDFPIR